MSSNKCKIPFLLKSILLIRCFILLANPSSVQNKLKLFKSEQTTGILNHEMGKESIIPFTKITVFLKAVCSVNNDTATIRDSLRRLQKTRAYCETEKTLVVKQGR